jgi:hypothetical protein
MHIRYKSYFIPLFLFVSQQPWHGLDLALPADHTTPWQQARKEGEQGKNSILAA